MMTDIQHNNQSYPFLGNYFRDITTDSPEAKIWFNRGLIWCYAFAFEEAKRCFEKAVQFDQQSHSLRNIYVLENPQNIY